MSELQSEVKKELKDESEEKPQAEPCKVISEVPDSLALDIRKILERFNKKHSVSKLIAVVIQDPKLGIYQIKL